MGRLDVKRVKEVLHDIGNSLTKIELTRKEAVYERSLEDLAGHVTELARLVQAPMARGTLEMPKLDAAGESVPVAIIPERSTAIGPPARGRSHSDTVPEGGRGDDDDFSESPTLVGRGT